jgi:Kef-type K+ transport system membrane component KefB
VGTDLTTEVEQLERELALLEKEKDEIEAERRWLEERTGTSASSQQPTPADGAIRTLDDLKASIAANNAASVSNPGKQQDLKAEFDATKNILEQLVVKVDRLVESQNYRRDDNKMDLITRAETEKNKDENDEVLANSALAMAPPLQAIIYLVAFSGIVFTLVFPALEKSGQIRRLMGTEEEYFAVAHDRRLGGPASGIIVAVCYSTLGAGLLALITSFLKQPILIGYILGGVLVGPVGLNLVSDFHEILTIMDLGLVLLLFMIGLEVDLHALLHMNRMTCIVGVLQFPICVAIHTGLFYIFQTAGVSFGHGEYSLYYMAAMSGVSSTMIVVKSLSHKMETETGAGKFTLGILLFQDFWAFVMVAIQPNISDPDFLEILKGFGFMGVLIYVSFSYSKYVLPPIFQNASGSTELMLVLSLAWCFFVCSVAVLPFINLSIEVAAFIGGVSMATFPYNAELNSKVKYIRDYFITLYFVGIGMQMNSPTTDLIVALLVICGGVFLARWIGIFLVATCLGSGHRLAILSTLNLAQLSEFGLVICTIGRKFGHIDDDTMSMAIWAFAVMAMAASYLIGYNHTIYHTIMNKARRLPCARLKLALGGGEAATADIDLDWEERDILILGFHKIAAALVSEFEHKSPQIMKKIHVIDHKAGLKKQLEKKNISFTAGDVTSSEVLRRSHKGAVDLVLITIPDYTITGVSNEELLKTTRQVWPQCHIIVIADDPKQIKRLYSKGANYVLATKKLSAERIADMLTEHYSDGLVGGALKYHLAAHRQQEQEWRAKLIDLNLGASKL